MYRKHLNEMEQKQQQAAAAAAAASANTKSGLKTIDRLAEIPIVNSAVSNVTDYYGKVKEKNPILRGTFNLAELSIKTLAFAATPINSLCKRPIESIDGYLCERVEDLEHSYPSITKPTEQLTSAIYNRTIREPIDTLQSIKDATTNRVTDSIDSIKSYGCDQLNRSALFGVRMVDACLETSLAKLFTNPVLNFTEKSLDYWLPAMPLTDTPGQHSRLQQSEFFGSETTLKRIYDINSRVFRLVYQTTFVQLNRLHYQFENTINKLQLLKQLSDSFYADSKEKVYRTVQTVSNMSLVSQCKSIVNQQKVSIEKADTLFKNYYKAILTDVTQMLEKYMSLVNNFPIAFNGTKLRQNVENLIAHLNKESFSAYLNKTIEQLKSINQILLTYTNQMFQVFTNNKYINFGSLNAKQSQLKNDSSRVSNGPTESTASADAAKSNQQQFKF
jgi:hypothetical protein